MRLLKLAPIMFCLAWLAGCSFQSDVILPDANAPGDVIAGLPTDAPFKLESFDRLKNAYHYIGTMTPETMDGGRVRYSFAFREEASKLLVVQAKQLSEGNYILRYAQIGAGPSLDESALMFLTIEGGTYYLLTNLGAKTLFEKVYSGMQPPEVINDQVKFKTSEQASRLSAYFAAHRDDFLRDQDYVRIRLMR